MVLKLEINAGLMHSASRIQHSLIPLCTRNTDKTKLIAKLVPRHKGKIYWPIIQLAELVFFKIFEFR